MGWGGASWGPKGRGWGEKVFPVMRGGAGMGKDKTMRGGDEDPILRPRPIAIPIPNGEILKYGVQLKFLATNNEVEYEEILTGLRLGKAFEAKNLLVQNDSKLVIGQIKGEYEAKEERMQKYLRLIKHLTQEFDTVEYVQILRSQNMWVI